METQYDKIFLKPLYNQLPHDGKELTPKIDFPPSTGKSHKSLDKHLYDVQSTLTRIKKSCEATELHCRRQTELIAKQREELKLL